MVVRLLVERGARLDIKDTIYGATPLGWAETSIRISRNPGCPAVAAWLRSLEGGG